MSLTSVEQAIYDANLERLSQLREDVRDAGYQWHHACWQRGYKFRISEAYRTQERQGYLYKIGRRGIRGEYPVTWTLDSFHTRRLAVDLYPIGCTHEDIASVAAVYDITHPFPKADPPHYEFTRVKAVLATNTALSPLQFFPRTVAALRAYLTRRLMRVRNERERGRIQKRLDELE